MKLNRYRMEKSGGLSRYNFNNNNNHSNNNKTNRNHNIHSTLSTHHLISSIHHHRIHSTHNRHTPNIHHTHHYHITHNIHTHHPQRPQQQPVVRDDEEDEYEGPTMGELSVPNFRDHTWPIYEGPDLAAITVNTSVIHNLPKFSGTKGESATSHLTRYHGLCLNLKPHGADVEIFKLKAFYFSLTDAAADWFLSLPPDSIYTWDQMQKQFVSKYYPAGRAAQVRKQLQELKQGPDETMYEYVEKFLALEKSCCNLELPEKVIVEYMLDGLRRLERKLLEASAGGNLMNLTPARVKQKIISVAESERFQDESTKEDEYARTKNMSKVEPSISAMAA
ncbi:unnamed protein product [Rhodiola kirilowii]